jgi:3-hydroxybutyryl-CoA dehydrogenase
MGIFQTSDMVDLNVTYGALMSMYKETGAARWFPPMVRRRKVKSGELGRKTGKGWYEYDKEGRRKR